MCAGQLSAELMAGERSVSVHNDIGHVSGRLGDGPIRYALIIVMWCADWSSSVRCMRIDPTATFLYKREHWHGCVRLAFLVRLVCVALVAI